MQLHPPTPTLFPSPTLFRSARRLVVHVIDSAKVPVAGAKVVAPGNAVATTDDGGVARFEQLPASDLSLRINADGYLPATRSEEHTSELQSHSDLVCRLLLEK